MKRRQTSKPTKIVYTCLISSHPGILEELEGIVTRAGIHARTLFMDMNPTRDFSSVQLPRGSIFVIDVSPSRQGAQSLVDEIMTRQPDAKVVVLKEKILDDRVFPFLRLGAKGFVSYAALHRELPLALRTVANGSLWIPRGMLSRFLDSVQQEAKRRHFHPPTSHLSRREREVMVGLLESLSNKEIANKLHISERTVKFHVSNLLAKFGAQKRSDLMLLHFQALSRAS